MRIADTRKIDKQNFRPKAARPQVRQECHHPALEPTGLARWSVRHRKRTDNVLKLME